MLLNGWTKFFASSISKSKDFSIFGKVTFETSSMKVLPKQMRIPPRKGLNENGFRFLPSGVKK